LLVGDPRQSTYATNDSSKYKKYKDGKIRNFIEEECPADICEIDTSLLNRSHRNNIQICRFSSKLYPEYTECEPCDCERCRGNIPDHQGMFLIKNADINIYCEKYMPVKLHYSKAELPDMNYGASKGLSFDRVLIYPTDKIRQYLRNGRLADIDTIRSKFYVAITRARHSVGIVCDEDIRVDGIEIYK
jgi:DNA helicase-2/ATP-dependent DNA helicase PcrA